jgi:glycosidase
MNILFDENDEAYRLPHGAIGHGQGLTLSLRCARGEAAAATLLTAPDGGGPTERDMAWREVQGSYDVFEAVFYPPAPGLYWYWFRVDAAGAGGSGNSGGSGNPGNSGGPSSQAVCLDSRGQCPWPEAPFQLTVYAAGLTTPAWIKGGLIYHIFVDRFCRGRETPHLKPGAVFREDWGGCPVFRPDEEGVVRNNDFFGGDLAGIIGKLPRLEAMGVTCLYLSPIFDAASNHKYDTGDYLRLDPGFGEGETLAALCRQAGERGMRVILDGVFSHVGVDSVYFNKYGHYNSQGAYQSRESPYYNWFTFQEWNTVYESWWGIALLPALNKREESYQAFITGENGVAAHWARQGIGGWRLDVVDELPDVFLDPLCRAIRRGDPEALIIGEVWEDASNKIAYDVRRRYFLGGQLDSVMNYPLKEGIIRFLREGDAGALADTLAWQVRNYPKPVLDCLMNVLGTHDTMRILTVLGGEDWPQTREEMALYRLTPAQRALGLGRLKLAAVLQYTLPGVPCLYYGDETGMEGGADPFNRRCYPWGREDRELLAWYQRLGEIRRQLTVFREGEYRLIYASGGVFAFRRGPAQEREQVVIAVNTGENEAVLGKVGPHKEWLKDCIREQCSIPGRGAVICTKVGAEGKVHG